jgi:hypothetical protein
MNITTIQIGQGGGYSRLLELHEPVHVEKAGNGLAVTDKNLRYLFDALGRFLRHESVAA